MALYHEFLTEDREFTSYEDLKAHCRLKAPEGFNFAYDVVDRYTITEPRKRALVWCDDNGEEHDWTFEDISAASKKTAYFLVSNGIKKGDTVMLILRRRYEWWWLMMALCRIGAIAVPATDQLLEKDIEYRTNAASIKMIISYDNPAVQTEIEKALKHSPTVQKLVTVSGKREGWIDFHEGVDKCTAEFPRPVGDQAVKTSDPMLLYFTSGTSGYPKMVIHDYLYPIGHIITAHYWQGVLDNGLHFTVSETGWGKAIWGKLYGQWIAGTAIFVYDMTSFKPDKMLQKIAQYKITTFCAPPTVYRYLIRQDLSKYDISTAVRFSTAGEALNGEVYNKFIEQTGKKIYEGYGQTESTIICGNFLDATIKPGSMGRPSPVYDVVVVNANGKEVPRGEEGELAILLDKGHPYGLFTSYYRDVTLTANAFDGDIYHTGDTVKMDEDGYVWFVGRKDDIIKSSGYRISPFEVESTLQQHPAVLECAVTGIPDEKRGQAVKASIVLCKGYQASHELEMQIMDFVKHETALYKCPRVIEFVDELPKTISGKIRRVEIREKDKGIDTSKIKQEF